MSVELHCVTYNVGGTRDMMLMMAKNPDIHFKDPQEKEIAQKFLQERRPIVTDPLYEGFRKAAEQKYISLALDTFDHLHKTYQPDLFCLQELYSRTPEKRAVCSKIEALGYAIYGERDVAIAYRKDLFMPVGHGATSAQPGAIFVDLKHMQTGKVIRVVSDHLCGFNAKTHKEEPKETKKAAPRGGDNQLHETLHEFEKIGSANQEKVAPDLIIYGLDANTTAKYLPTRKERLHPKRLKQFIDLGYSCDVRDIRPTIFDHNDGMPRKYDYIFCKAFRGQHPEIHSGPLEMIPSSANAASDHLPVLATIKWDYQGI
jgi:endonuclease/exonuclease/phosphatase family metal-dependent hydrolase